MSQLNKFRKIYAEENPEKFNEDFIYLKKKENVLDYINPICKSLEILPQYTFLGSDIQNIDTVYKFTKEEKEIDIEQSELILINIHFRLKKDDREEEITKSLYFPKLIEDGMYFIINGNRYDLIYQLLDSGTYRTNKSLTLKTLLMPISLKEEKDSFTDINNIKHTMLILNLDLFKKKIPFFIYYFAKMGFKDTLKYFGIENKIRILNKTEYENLNEKYLNNHVLFMVTKNFIISFRKNFFNNKKNNPIVGSFLKCFNSRVKIDKIYEKDYWTKKLGGIFTTNNSNKQEKGEGILLSFERILDCWTKEILRVSKENKENVYAIVRWMVLNYYSLIKQDNMNLANKRLRVYEYLLYGLLYKFSKGVYRILNTRNLTFEKLKSILTNIRKGMLIKDIINSELVRYSNAVNSINIFNSSLKFTVSGPQSPFNGNGIAVKSRGIHPSYLGRIDLVSTSPGDPGISGTLCPFLELPKNCYMHFTKDPEIICNRKIKSKKKK